VIEMVIYPLQESQYIVRFNKKYSLKYFVEFCNVSKNTYGEDFSRRIYNKVIGHAIDVRQEFENYYSTEYQSLKEFLFWKYCVPDIYFDDLFQNYSQSTFIGIIQDYSLFYGDEDDFMKVTILHILNELDN